MYIFFFYACLLRCEREENTQIKSLYTLLKQLLNFMNRKCYYFFRVLLNNCEKDRDRCEIDYSFYGGGK